MTKDKASLHHGQIVEWLARLPLMRLDELAVLLGEPVESVEPVLREMERRGWVDWVESSSLELEPGRAGPTAGTPRDKHRRHGAATCPVLHPELHLEPPGAAVRRPHRSVTRARTHRFRGY